VASAAMAGPPPASPKDPEPERQGDRDRDPDRGGDARGKTQANANAIATTSRRDDVDGDGPDRGALDLEPLPSPWWGKDLPQVLRKHYRIVGKIGEGTSGVVYMAKGAISGDGDGDGDGDEHFAVKVFKSKVSSTKRGVCTSAIREICLLRELRHPNVIRLKGVHVAPKDRSVFLSYEYASYDLQQVIKYHASLKKKIPEYTIKSLLWQILSGLDYLHSNWVMHRDLKPSNVLILAEGTKGTSQGVVKIADFGLARVFQVPLQPLKDNGVVVTLWYRAPELLLGARHYSPAIDVWSAGCLFAELIRLRPLFHADQLKGSQFQAKQMQRVVRVLGRPSVSRWPALAETPHWKHNAGGIQGFKPGSKKLESILGLGKDSPAMRLLRRMLEYDPEKRITAAEALQDPYFHACEPLPGANCFAAEPGATLSSLPYPSRTFLREPKAKVPGEQTAPAAPAAVGGGKQKRKRQQSLAAPA